MKKNQENPLFAISPQRLFETEWNLKPLGKKIKAPGHLLRDMLGMEESVALIYGAYSSKALLLYVEGDLSHEGDGIELFLDTRPGASQVVGRFCHQFAFSNDALPPFREVTPFRTPEESHPLCEPGDLSWRPAEGGVEVEIPFRSLAGWGEGVKTLGFALRLQCGGRKQHLGVSAREGSFELHPALWGRLTIG